MRLERDYDPFAARERERGTVNTTVGHGGPAPDVTTSAR
jgi:hypothetical protein